MMLFLVMIASGIIIIPIGEEFSEHLLNVIQDFLLGLGGLLLSFHPSAEVIIVVIGHMYRYFARLHRAVCCWRSIPTNFSVIVWPSENIFWWFWWNYPNWRGWLFIVIGYCYPGSGALEHTFLPYQDLAQTRAILWIWRTKWRGVSIMSPSSTPKQSTSSSYHIDRCRRKIWYYSCFIPFLMLYKGLNW